MITSRPIGTYRTSHLFSQRRTANALDVPVAIDHCGSFGTTLGPVWLKFTKFNKLMANYDHQHLGWRLSSQRSSVENLMKYVKMKWMGDLKWGPTLNWLVFHYIIRSANSESREKKIWEYAPTGSSAFKKEWIPSISSFFNSGAELDSSTVKRR